MQNETPTTLLEAGINDEYCWDSDHPGNWDCSVCRLANAQQLSEKPAIVRLDTVHPCDMAGCTNITYWQINGRMRCMKCSDKAKSFS